jgi:hypothetical protein
MHAWLLINNYLIFPYRNFILKYTSSLSDHEILSVCRKYGSAKVRTEDEVLCRIQNIRFPMRFRFFEREFILIWEIFDLNYLL